MAECKQTAMGASPLSNQQDSDAATRQKEPVRHKVIVTINN